jgi:hypothetical protein
MNCTEEYDVRPFKSKQDTSVFSFCGDQRQSVDKENRQPNIGTKNTVVRNNTDKSNKNHLFGKEKNHERLFEKPIAIQRELAFLKLRQDVTRASVRSNANNNSPAVMRNSSSKKVLRVYHATRGERDSVRTNESTINFENITLEDRKNTQKPVEMSILNEHCRKYYSDYLRVKVNKKKEQNENSNSSYIAEKVSSVFCDRKIDQRLFKTDYSDTVVSTIHDHNSPSSPKNESMLSMKRTLDNGCNQFSKTLGSRVASKDQDVSTTPLTLAQIASNTPLAVQLSQKLPISSRNPTPKGNLNFFFNRKQQAAMSQLPKPLLSETATLPALTERQALNLKKSGDLAKTARASIFKHASQQTLKIKPKSRDSLQRGRSNNTHSSGVEPASVKGLFAKRTKPVMDIASHIEEPLRELLLKERVSVRKPKTPKEMQGQRQVKSLDKVTNVNSGNATSRSKSKGVVFSKLKHSSRPPSIVSALGSTTTFSTYPKSSVAESPQQQRAELKSNIQKPDIEKLVESSEQPEIINLDLTKLKDGAGQREINIVNNLGRVRKLILTLVSTSQDYPSENK